jgi:6-phosphofructokinase 1
MIERIGILTGGSDCPGLNAVIRAAVLAAKQRGWAVLGIEDGLSGLIDLDYRSPHGNRWLSPRDVHDVLRRGGTFLGTSSRKNPFQCGEDVALRRAVENARTLGLDALVCVGGRGALRLAQRLNELGLPVVGVPKTIAMDLDGTDATVGFHTAVQTVTDAIDRLQDTAESHDRIMIVEVMGYGTGWIALHAAIAGGAHVCLIPEIRYRIERVVAKVEARRRGASPYCLVVVADGASPLGVDAKTPRQDLTGTGARLASALAPHLDLEIRLTVLGHIQRGGSPVQFDRVLGTRFGVAAVELIADGRTGTMTSLRTPDVVAVPLAQALRGPRRVDTSGPLLRSAAAVGVELGDAVMTPEFR